VALYCSRLIFLTFYKLNYFHLHGTKPQNLMMKRAADVNSLHSKKEKKSPRSSRVKSPGNKALDGNGKLRTTNDGGGGQMAEIVSPAKSFVDAKSSSLSQLNVAGVHDSHVDDSETNIIVIDVPKKRKKSSLIASSKSLKGKKLPSIASSKSLIASSRRMFRVCVDLFSKIKAHVDFIMLELLIFCACALSHHVCVLEV
jgi:hypothetical protein